MSRTVVAFHAHPDDEALLTGGTLAKAAAHGHRVVVVVATDGELGLTSAEHRSGEGLASRRLAELAASARALGVHRVEHLGYADSGMGPHLDPDPPGQVRFLRADPGEAADKLAAILDHERADVLLSYDENGGYGHRDHILVHQVASLAAERAGTARVLEATVPRDLICWALNLVGKVYRFPPDFDPASFQRAYSPRSQITHRINVSRQIRAKRAAMAAHVSQAVSDDEADRTLAALLRLPLPLFTLAFGREWYVDPCPADSGRVARDIFEGLGESHHQART